jgi:hypothetical protein
MSLYTMHLSRHRPQDTAQGARVLLTSQRERHAAAKANEQPDGLRCLHTVVWEYMERGSQVFALQLNFSFCCIIFTRSPGTSE